MMPSWSMLRELALHAYQAAIEADPLRFRAGVEAFVGALAEARARLDRIRTLLARVEAPDLEARADVLEARYADLAAGLGSDAQPDDTVGLAPVGLAVAGVVIGVAGIAWATAGYQYAVNLREQTALLEAELRARIDASRSGQPLQPSTIPPGPALPARRVGLVLLGGLTLAAVALAVPIWLRRSG